MDKSVTIISRAGSHLRDMGLIIGLLLLLGAVSPCFLWNFFFGLIVFACAIPILVLLGRSAFWSEEVKVADNALTFTTRFLRGNRAPIQIDSSCIQAPNNWGTAVSAPIWVALACRYTAKALKKLSPAAVIVADATDSCWDKRRVRRSHVPRSLRRLKAASTGLGPGLFT